jgi:urea transport system substrate-binding protein
MPSVTTCPSPEVLDDLLANRLPAASAEQVRRHVASCAACQARLGRTRTAEARSFPFLSPPRGEGELGWLGEYRVRGLLGEGGMAYVFDAEDLTLHRRVAIKVLKPEMCDDTTRRRFLNEARALARLPHEHIVTLYEVGEVDGSAYMAMERLRGESLEDRLERDHWLSLAEALARTREAAEGLAAAHGGGLVHRDIKPSNLWLETTEDGRFKRVKLIDFGIARRADSATDSSLTQVNMVVGTPRYMAPEQAAGRPVDARTDLYSLGCVLFRMLTGRTPFAHAGEDTLALLQAAVAGQTDSISSVAPRLPPRVADLIRNLLAVNPDNRPASAEELIRRIRDLEQEQRQGHLDVLPAPRKRVRARRTPGWLGIFLGGLVILAALVVGAVTAYQKFVPHDEPDGEDGETKPPVATGPPLVVGVLHSLSHTVSIHERPIVQATRMAIDEINEKGGVLGRRIEIRQADGASEELVFAREAKRLIEQEKVEVLFGCWTSSSRKRVAEVCARHNRLLFYPASCEGLELSPNVVYLGGTPNQTVLPLVQWASSTKRKRRFFIVGSESVYSHAITAILEHEIEDLRAGIVGTHFALVGETDFSAVAQRIKEAKPDMILCSIDGQSNLSFCQALRRANIRQERSNAEGATIIPTVWFNIGENELSLFRLRDMKYDYSVGCYFESIPRPENKAFLDRFHQRFGAAERVNDPMQTAYFGVYLWAKAVEKAGGTGFAEVREALRNLTVDAPEGPIRLDGKTQHAWRTAMVGQIRGAKQPAEFRIVYSSPGPQRPEPFPPWRTKAEWKTFLHELYKKWGNHWEKHK